MSTFNVGRLPFARGDTLKGTDADGNLIHSDLEGQIFQMQDVNVTGNQRGGKGLRTNWPVFAVCCRNTYGAALLGKRLGVRERDTTNIYEFGGRVNGYSAVLRQSGIVAIDDRLPSAGVASNDFFWGILSGGTVLLTANAGTDFPEDIAAHARLIAGTAAGTTTTLAGRIASVTLSTATQALETPILGWALTARTTGNTGSEVFVRMTLGFRE